MRQERLVGDRLHEARPEGVRGHAEGADVVLEGHALDDLGVRRPRVDQRAAEGLEEHVAVQPPGAVLRDLARASGHDVLVALAAGLRVVGRAEAVVDAFDLLEDEAVVVEGAQGDDVVLLEGLEVGPLLEVAVGEVVEARRSLGSEAPRGGPRGLGGDGALGDDVPVVVEARRAIAAPGGGGGVGHDGQQKGQRGDDERRAHLVLPPLG